MPPSPVPLSPSDKLRYDELYRYLGKEEADSWATGLEQRRQELGITPAPVAAPATPMPTPVTIQLGTDASGRPTVRAAPIGTTPPPVVMPEMRQQLQDRPGIPALRMTQDELAESAIKVRTITNQKQGMDYDSARKEAEEYVRKAREVPRTIEFKPKPSPIGYSELAVRGEELLPRMSAGEATLQSFAPQVLETADQAEGRRRFERDKRAAIARFQEEQKRTGKDYKQILELEKIRNDAKVQEIATQMYGPNYDVSKLMEIRAAVNAPLYAAAEELRFKNPNERIEGLASDVLRGLTQEEKQGRLVETKGATVLRDIGGLTRYGIEAMREATKPATRYLVTEYVGAKTGIPAEDIRAQMAADEAKTPVRRVATADKYEPGFEARQRLETGSYFKDVAYQIATGRSAIDDYVDTGMDVGLATVLGFATEIALPATPLGYVTDIAVPLAKASTKIPVVGRATSAFGRGLSKVGDLPEAIRLSRFIGDQVKTAEDMGRVMENPGFWKTWSNVSDARVSLAENIARDSADLVAMSKTLEKGGEAGTAVIAARVADVIDGTNAGSATTRKIASDLYEEIVTKGGGNSKELVAALRNPDAATINAVNEYAKKTVRDAVVGVTSKNAPDIVRNTFAKARTSINAFDDDISDVVSAAIAETLEKVPNSEYMFITPRMMVKKSIVADKAFQTAVADAVKTLPPTATVDDVSKTVEDVVRSRLKGSRLGQTAEPVAVRPPRDEGLLPQAPRGGLERIATPEARRVPVVEVAQDIRDTVRAIIAPSPKLGKLASETFAGSQQLSAVGKTLDNALEARIPIQMRDFLTATKSEIDALTIMQMPTRTPRGLVPGAAPESGGIIINAIRAQGENGLDAYLTARIEANAEDPFKLRASRVDGPVGTKVWDEIDEAAKIDATTQIVRSFFKGSVELLTDPDSIAVINRAVAAGVKDSPDALTAVAMAISEVRSAVPELVGAGRRGVGLAFQQDDIASAVLDYIIKQEAKVIFGENFYKFYPDLRFNTTGFADHARAAIIDRLDFLAGTGSGMTMSSNLQKAKDIVNNFARIDVNKEELAQAAKTIVNNEITRGVIDFSSPSVLAGFGPNTRKMIMEINALGEPSITVQVMQGIKDVTHSHTSAISEFLYQNKVIRPVTESDVITFMADDLFVPLPQTQRAVIENLIGPIADLSKGKGAIADNLSAIYRNPSSGLGATFSTLFKSFVDTVRTTSVPGLTAGVVLPNIKFHAINYLGAPMVMAVTSPGLASRALLGELSRVIPIRAWQETNLNFTRQMAKTDPEQIAFRTANGIPYTYGQLDKLLNENYFGMTEQVFAFGNKFGEDVRIELGLDHSGTPVRGLDKARDKVQNYLNVAGSGQYVKFASSIDTAWRQQAFLAALKSGETVEGARRVAQNAVMDYGRIPASMRQMASRYMTFFSWFAVSNAELFSALFRPAAASNISKMVRAQRELHKGFGEWTYSDDASKKRMFSFAIGNYDELPAYFVGPENPWAGPLIDQTSIALGLYSIASGDARAEDAVASFSNAIVEKSFTPFLGYLSDIGALGESGALGKVVPAKQIAFHRAMGDEHFALWMAENNITTVPIDERRLGEPTFYGQQYMYADEASRKRAAAQDLILTYLGLSRAISDYQAMGFIISGGGEGTDPKRFENRTLGLLQYFAGGNLQKGTTEHEAVRNSIISANSEIKKMGEQ